MKHAIMALLLMSLLTLNVMPAMAAGEEGTEQEQTENNVSATESESEADEKGFVIENGVLIKYVGTDTKITIPNDVTSIGNSAFENCSNITSVSIPNTVTSIGKWAFRNCSNVTNINIPDSVTTIGMDAFTSCSSLANISIPNSVISMGDYTFSGCSALASVSLPDSIPAINDGMFSGCSALADIRIPESVTAIGAWAFSGCRSLTSIRIPDNVEMIGSEAFCNCSALTSIIIPNSVTIIGGGEFNAFLGCDSVTIYGEEGSYAQKFANENNIPFRLIGSEESTYTDENGIEKRKITAGKNGEITLEGDSKVLPQRARFKVERLGSGNLYDKAAEALKKELKNVQNYTVFEMTLLDSANVEIHELEGYVSVTIPIPEGMLTGNGKTLVVYRLDNGTLTKCETTVADGNVTFLTNHFSTYVFTETDAENTMGAGTSGQNSQNNQNSQKKSPLTGDPGFSKELDLTDILLLEGIVVVGGLFVTVCYWSICGRKRKR